MRSIRLLAATAVILTGAWACGGDGGGVGPNDDPHADFTVGTGTCTVGVACAFADVSTDPDGDNTITTRSWNFGDGSAVVDNPGLTPSHTYTAPGTFHVTLTVTDNGGKTNVKAIDLVVNGGTPNNLPPVASFTVSPASCTSGAACTFTSTSTDPDGTIATAQWDFGDLTTGEGLTVDHTYNVTTSTPFTVVLTVTDNLGATATSTQTVTVAPAAATQCTTAGTVVSCILGITQRSTVNITLTGVSCEITGNSVALSQPRRQTVFFNVCSKAAGTVVPVRDANGAALVLEVGAQLQIDFERGTPDLGDPPAGNPQATVDGTFPTWTVNIDDGGNTGGLGEPDFTDVVLTVQATTR
jgi:PKD repeat protein